MKYIKNDAEMQSHWDNMILDLRKNIVQLTPEQQAVNRVIAKKARASRIARSQKGQ